MVNVIHAVVPRAAVEHLGMVAAWTEPGSPSARLPPRVLVPLAIQSFASLSLFSAACLLLFSAASPVCITCVTCVLPRYLRHLRPPAPSAPHTATLEPAEHARVPPRRVPRSGPQLLSRTSLPTAPVPAPLLPPEPCFSRPYPAYPETPAPHTLRTACTSMRMGSREHEDGQLAPAAAWHLRTPPEARSVSAATSRLVG